MARAALGQGIRELARAAKVSTDTVARFERGEELKERTVEAIQRALEVAGVEFTNGDQPGVRLTRLAAAGFVSKPTVGAGAIRGKVAKATEEKSMGIKRAKKPRPKKYCSQHCRGLTVKDAPSTRRSLFARLFSSTRTHVQTLINSNRPVTFAPR